MKKRHLIASLLAAGITASALPGLNFPLPAKAEGNTKPIEPDNPTDAAKTNVLFILADDLGYMDVALNGSTYYETPHIQRLAEKGTTFTNAYAHPLCSPTRSALLSGQYPHRTMINAPSCHLPDNSDGFQVDANGPAWCGCGIKNSLNGLPTGIYSIGQAFKDNGYRTALIGKTHLGVAEKYQMRQFGFDHDMGMPVPGPGSYYSPYFHQPNNRWDTGPLNQKGEHLTDRLAREADAYITECARAGEAFFLELWDFSVHAPFEAKKEYVDYFRNKQVPDSPQNGHYQMAAMLKTMDDAVGKVLDSLERNGIADHTIVVFMGDNGGNMYDSINGSFPTNNYPLRQGKGTIYEGGIRVPCVVFAPGVTSPGSVVRENIHAVDFYPTLLDLAGITVDPEKFREANHESVIDRTQVLDGMSLVPLLNGSQTRLDRPGVFTNFLSNVPAPGNLASAAVNSGDWKLIIHYGSFGGLKEPFELYNLKDDISEIHNLADRYPEKVAELKGYIEAHQASIPQAMPQKNPNEKPGAEVPFDYIAWSDWVKDFAEQVEADPTVKEYPKVVTESDELTYFRKAQPLIIARENSRAVLLNGYDATSRLPLEKTASGYRISGDIFGVHTSYVSASDQGLKAFVYDGFVAFGETDPAFTQAETERTNRYLDSYEKADHVPFKPIPTPTMTATRTYTYPPKGLDQAVKSWDFADGSNGWTGSGMSLAAGNGTLSMTTSGRNATILSPAFSLDAKQASVLHVRYRNDSDALTMNIFWTTAEDPENHDRKCLKGVPIFRKNSRMADWYIDLKSSPDWNGTITSIRIEPMAGVAGASVPAGQSITYDIVELCPNKPEVRWDFTDGMDGWYEGTDHISAEQHDGILHCTIHAPDPYLNHPRLSVPLSDYNAVRIRYKNQTSSPVCQVFYTTDLYPNIRGQFKNFTLKTNMTEFEEIVLPMDSVPKWKGILTLLRLDVADTAHEGTFLIDYIELCSVQQ